MRELGELMEVFCILIMVVIIYNCTGFSKLVKLYTKLVNFTVCKIYLNLKM